ncbi:uncharacterized protein LOC105893679 [Clupea harengus]|uniref:Uncharacterized protein LOC105893679 n=1 Tax=Clupea harengus TaxID=7950 RepID=A0A6P8EP58_CLUHA|nr:uncharacterized protein LOC105893679 [Clupea harengus]
MCKTGVQPSEEHLDRRHFRYAVHFKEHGVDLFTVPCYCDRLPDMKRSHWHCFKCGAILSRRHVLKRHLEIHGCTSLKDYSTDCPAAPSGQAGPCPVDPETSVLTSGQETDADDTENISQSPHASSLEGPPTDALTSISDLASGVEDGGGVESGDGGVVRSRLKHHSLKHQGRIPSIRRCLCPLCGRSFPRLDLRRNHMRVCPARFPPAATQGSARRQLQPLRAPPDTPS